MSRQQKRANERKKSKTAFQKICLAAGEGVGRAVAFSLRAGQQRLRGGAEERGTYHRCRRWSCKTKTTPTSCPNPRYRNSRYHSKTCRNRSPSCRKNSSKNRPAPLCAMRCAMCLASPSPPAKAAELRVTFSSCAGFNARNDTFIDGVRDSGSYFRDSFNLDSVEVLKGPSSTFFGRGSTGGIINQVSKSPRLDPSYEGIFSGGAGPLFRGTIDVNQPIPQVLPNAAFRINLMAHGDDVVGSRQGRTQNGRVLRRRSPSASARRRRLR